MKLRPLWTWLRGAIARRLGRAIPTPTLAVLPAFAEATVPSAGEPSVPPTPAPAADIVVLRAPEILLPVPGIVPPLPEVVAPALEFVPFAPEIVAPPAPGRFESDAELGMLGKLYDAPHKRRQFFVYVPAGWSADVRAPLIVLCHGCQQTPEQFAQGTRIAALADRLGCLVLMPRQTKWANPFRCWNWFDPSVISGGGEAAIVARQIRFIRQRYRADSKRVMAVGISAGAALAAALGLCFPRQVRAVVTHSGVACGAAGSAIAAHDVMQRGPHTADVEAIGVEAHAKFESSLPVPLLAIHGADDTVVSPANSIALVRQYLRFNGHTAMSAATPASAEMPVADSTTIVPGADGRDVTTREWHVDGRLVVRHVAIAGLGHAWSGGDAALPFNDARAPDASALVGDFLGDTLQ